MLMELSKILKPALAVDKDKYPRPQLTGVCFDYNDEIDELTIVGTDATIMILTKMTGLADDEKEFARTYFNKSIYLIPGDMEKSKLQAVEITAMSNGDLRAGDFILKKIDAQYPNYECAIPTKDLASAKIYMAFSPRLIKIATKAAGLKSDDTIARIVPLMNTNATCHDPAVWEINDCKIILMPMRLKD